MTTTTTTFKVMTALITTTLFFWGSAGTPQQREVPQKTHTIRMDEECLQKLRDTAFYKSGEVMAKIKANK